MESAIANMTREQLVQESPDCWELTDAERRKPDRRLRFSLRTLFLIVTGFAIATALIRYAPFVAGVVLTYLVISVLPVLAFRRIADSVPCDGTLQ